MTQLRELQLMKRTAWMNDQLERNPPERPNDARDEQDLITAMYMLAYLGAIDMALIDLQEELENAGLYKHAQKYNFNRVVKTVSKANGLANYILKAVNNGERVRQYADMYEYAYNATQQQILIDVPHNRSYCI